jgi:hypothetical protein
MGFFYTDLSPGLARTAGGHQTIFDHFKDD